MTSDMGRLRKTFTYLLIYLHGGAKAEPLASVRQNTPNSSQDDVATRLRCGSISSSHLLPPESAARVQGL